MHEIQLNLTVDEANLILEALGQQPFVKVFGLIQKIQQQASQQLNGADAPAIGPQGDSSPTNSGS